LLKRKYEERSVERDEDTGTVETTSSTTGAKRKLPRLPLLGAVVFVALGMWAASTTFGGALASVYVYAFLNFFAGVVSLVALSLTVMCGLVATDRFFLKIGHRVFFQGLHRATAIIAMVFLGLHIAMKVLSGSATLIDPLVPFSNPLDPIYIGLGTVASYLMVTTFWTGLIRARFAGSGKPWMWRTLHATSYVAWPAALGHGLNAGRPAATWVWLSYSACVIGVLVALLVRVYVQLGRRTTGKMGPSAVGVNVETAIIPRVADGGFRDGPVTSTREQRAIRDDDLENTATRMMTTARPPREPEGERQDARVGYAMPVAPPEPRRPREEERVPDELVSPGERRAARPERSEARRSRLEQMDERAEERRVLERPPAPRGESVDVGERLDDLRRQERRASRSGSRTEDKRSATQWRRGKSKPEPQEADLSDREWYESLRGNEPVSGYGPVSGAYAPSSPAPAPQPERERYGRGEQGGGRRRAEQRGERWTSPADERYADIDPVSAPVSRYDQSREPVSGPAPRYDQSRAPISGPAPRYDQSRAPISGPAPRYDQSREPVSGPAPRYDQSRVDPVSAPAGRYDQSRYDEPRYEQERPRRAALRLVTDDDTPRQSRRSRSSRGQEEPRPSRRGDGRHSLGEDEEGPIQYASEPGYERPGPYPPAVDPMPSRRSRRGRRAAGGEDLDNGAYWTRPREGYGR
jgi:hypothetical protein